MSYIYSTCISIHYSLIQAPLPKENVISLYVEYSQNSVGKSSDMKLKSKQ